ncbi:MAG: DUF945 family protein [Gammaproteobacteria bacterium]|jgi:hypothetical protein
MKRKLLIIIAILTVALLVIPNFVGGGIQSATVDSLLERMSAETRAALDIEQTQFERGWFSSQARIEVRLDELDELAGEPVTVLLDLDIRHGPLLFTPQGLRLGTAYAYIAPSVNGLAMENLAPDAAVETLESLLYLYAGFDSTLELGINVDQLVASSPEFRFSVADIRGTSLILPDLSSAAEAEFTTTTLTATNGQFDLAMQNLLASGSRSDVSRPVSLGESTIFISQLSSSAPLPLTLHSLRADYRLSDSPGKTTTMDFSQNFSVGSIDWDMPITSFDWQLQVSQLSRQLLESYLQLAQEASQAPTDDPAQSGASLNYLSQGFILGLAREAFQLDNTLQLGAFDGTHSLTLDINWPGLPDLASIEAFDPGAALNAVAITLTFDGDQAALMNSPFAQTVIDYQAMLEVDAGRVKAFVSLANGELNINGDILPLEQFVNL